MSRLGESHNGSIPVDAAGDRLHLLAHTTAEIGAHAAQHGVGALGLCREMIRTTLQTGVFDPAIAGANDAHARAWRDYFAMELPRVRQRIREAGTGSEKAVLEFSKPSDTVETVRVPLGRGRESQCLSTQIGCRMACRFCETGRMGLRRNLTAAEIVSQVVVARGHLGWRPTSLVFMGMGEPLDNLDALIRSLRVLTDRHGLAYAHDKITVCTVGRAAGIDRLRALGWKRLNLALSLNAGNDALRRELMPHPLVDSLADLRAALQGFRQRKNLQLGIHYCLIPGRNDSRTDAAEVAAFCHGLGRVMVHLIPYNPGTKPLSRAPTETEVERFVSWLRAAGLPVRRRITKGRSVMAACGQLGDPGR